MRFLTASTLEQALAAAPRRRRGHAPRPAGHRRRCTPCPPAQAEDEAASQSTVEQGRALFLVGCASCHGQNGEGITQRGTQWARRWSVSAPPPWTSRSAPAGCRWPSPACRPRKDVLYSDEARSPARRVRRLARSRPLGPDRGGLQTPSPRRSARRPSGGEFFRTNCTACHNFAGMGGALPGGKYARP